jgi:phosphate transport system substrate-binding protein
VHRHLVLLSSLLLLAATGCAGQREPEIHGGGSSFVNPIMTKWSGVYQKDKGVRVDYTSSGSGNGIQQMIDKKNDFGCTDAPMNEEQMAKAGQSGEVVHIPLVMGGIVPAYNLKSIDEPLRFTGPVLADIFLGKITRWNDARIAELNPAVKELPAADIAVVHRSDGSGSTYIWADYLAKVSPEWKERVGVGTDLKWPVGVGAQKNDGVAGQIARTPGSIGYVELIFVLRNQIQYGAVQNREGEFVRADLKSVTTAAAGALTNISDDLRYSLTDAPGKGAYPICGTTWAVMYTNEPGPNARLLGDFFHWVTHDGQEYAAELHYARLPPGLVRRAEELLKKIKAAK